MTMKCPKCNAEFEDGMKLCTNCKIPLIKKEEQHQHKAEGVDVVKLTSVSDHVDAELLMGLLKNQGIPSYSLDKESGGYMRVYMGYSVFGEDIYVRASDLTVANACLEEWGSKKNTEENLQTEAQLNSRSEASQVKPESQSEVQSEFQAGVQPESRSAGQSDSRSEAQPESRPEAQPELQPEGRRDSQAEAQPETGEEWEEPKEQALENEEEAKEIMGSKPLLFQNKRTAAIVIIVVLIIAAIAILPKL